jgi:hypothetical protein
MGLKGFVLWNNDVIFTNKISPEVLARIKQQGFNFVQTEFFWTSPYLGLNHGYSGALDHDPTKTPAQVFIPGNPGLAFLDNFLTMLDRAGLKTYLIMRVCISPSEQQADPLGHWAGWAPNAEYVVNNMPDASGTGGLDRFIAMWKFLAKNLDYHPCLLGYNLWNFPFHAESPDSATMQRYWNTVVPALIQAVRQYSSKAILISPIHKASVWSSALGGYDESYYFKQPIPNDYVQVPLDPKNNLCMCVDGYPTPPAFGIDTDRASLQGFADFQKKYNIPLFIDEFGIISIQPNVFQQADLDFLVQHMELMEQLGLRDWAYHMYTDQTSLNWGCTADITLTTETPVMQILKDSVAKYPPGAPVISKPSGGLGSLVVAGVIIATTIATTIVLAIALSGGGKRG